MLIGGPAKSARRRTPKKRVYSPPRAAYPTPAPRRAAPRPTPQQLRSARATERSYRSQGKAVKRAAVDQRTKARTGLTREQRTRGRTRVTPGTRSLQERYFRSQGRGVERQGTRQATGLTRAQLDRVLRADRRQTKQIGFSARERYGYTPKVTKTNVMPLPKELREAKRLGYLETDPRKLRKAGFTAPGALEKAVTSPKYAIKAISNIPKDVGELAIGTPTSIAHAAVEQTKVFDDLRRGRVQKAGKRELKLVKQQVEPYKQLAKDPLKFATEHPVTTALMVAPGAKVPKLAAGKGARVARVKSQSPERPPAVLPGTTLRQHRVGSREADKRAKQAREDKRNPQPRIRTERTMTRPVSELDRRVDEFEDWSQQQKVATVHAATRQEGKRIRKQEGGRVKRTAKRVRAVSPRRATRERHREQRAERRAEVETKLSGAKAGARQHTAREMVREFGSHWRVDPASGALIKPKNAPESSGVIHASKADAKKVVEALERNKDVTWTPRIVELEGATPGETAGFGVIPDEVADRIAAHGRVGRKGYVVGPGLRGGSRMFRQTVLPVSTKWLGGQVVEGAVRSMAHSGSPLPLLPALRGHRFLKAYERQHGKQAADALRMRAVSGGQFGVTGPATEYARQLRGEGKTWQAEFENTAFAPIGKAATQAGKLPVVKQARGAYRKYAETVFGDINGPIERFYKTGMLGKEIKKQSPVLDRKIIGLTSRALDEAARGHHGTAAQVELGRQIDRAYGKYSKHSPEFRDTIMHTTPFIPWMRNMGQFLLTVMPKDHPVASSLTASLNAADQEWRKRHRLSFYGKDRVPSWIMGSYPTGKDKYVPASRYMPFLPGEYTGAAASQVYPQFFGVLQNLSGVDWKGQEIEGGEGAKIANAALTGAEALIPLVGVGSRVTGLGERYVRGKKEKESVVQGKKISQGLLDQLNPVKPIGITSDRKRRKKKKDGFGGSNIGSGGFGSSGLR